MNLFYYSLPKKKFLPLFSTAVSEHTLRKINRYSTTTSGFFGESVLLSPLTLIAWLGFKIAGLFVLGSGWLLDKAIQFTISSALYQDLQVINVAWTTVRDFSNMFFIFALLYIAIKTILGMAGGSTKKWVANLIIAAILINFSLFATKVVVDAGNVLAMGFWEKMTITTGGETKNSAAEHLMQGLKLQTSFDLKDINGEPIETDTTKKIFIYLGGALLMLVAGYVFLAGAFMMISRTVTLIMLMIFSPFAFLSFALPVGGGFGQYWIKKLIGSAFVAPAFLAMVYLNIIIINGLDLNKLSQAGDSKLGGAFSGDVGSFPIIYNFIVVIMLMLASLTVASSVSSGAGEQGGKLAKRFIGVGAGVSAAGLAMGGRQLGGRLGKRFADSDALKKLAGNQNSRTARFVGNLGLATAEKAKKGSWDARNAGLNSALGLGGVSAGGGSKRNFESHGSVGSSMVGGYRGTAKESELIEIAKKRYALDPEAQKAYLTDRSVDLTAKRNKEVKSELDRGVNTKGVKSQITEQTKKYEEAKKKALSGEANDSAELIRIEKEVAVEMKKLIAQLSGKETSELLTKDQLKMAPIIAALQSKDLTALNAKAGEFPPEIIEAITSGVVSDGTASARSYLKSQTKVGGPFSYDAEANLKTLTKEYDDKKIVLGGEDTPAFKEYAIKQKAEIGRALGMVGGANEIKELSDDLVIHEAVVSQYNGKVARELKKKIADIDGAESQIAKDFDIKLNKYNERAREATENAAASRRDSAANRATPRAQAVPLNPEPLAENPAP